jgi:hypothetical protein
LLVPWLGFVTALTKRYAPSEKHLMNLHPVEIIHINIYHGRQVSRITLQNLMGYGKYPFMSPVVGTWLGEL